MNTTHRAIAASLTTVALATALSAPRADAKLDRIGNGTSPTTGVTETVFDADRPCFMVRANWNVSLDGPQPTCPQGRF